MLERRERLRAARRARDEPAEEEGPEPEEDNYELDGEQPNLDLEQYTMAVLGHMDAKDIDPAIAAEYKSAPLRAQKIIEVWKRDKAQPSEQPRPAPEQKCSEPPTEPPLAVAVGQAQVCHEDPERVAPEVSTSC